MRAHYPHSFRTLTTTVSAYRTAAPDAGRMAAIRLDGEWILVDCMYLSRRKKDLAAEWAGMKQKLAQLQISGEQVRVALRRRKDGRWQLLWLLADSGDLTPMSRRQRIRRATPGTLKCLAGTVVSALVTAFAFYIAFTGEHIFILFLGVFATVATLACLAGVAIFIPDILTAVFSRCERAAQQALAKAQANTRFDYYDTVARADAAAATTTEPPAQAQILANDEQSPPLLHRRGRATDMQVSFDSHGGGTGGGFTYNFAYYHFTLDGQRYVVTASASIAGHEIFLAEGDNVELVATGGEPIGKTRMRFVLAFRNLVDGQTYACHRAALHRLPPLKHYRLTGMTGSQWRWYRRFILFCLAIVWLLFAVLVMTDASLENKLLLLAAGLGVFAAAGLLVQAPRTLWRLKWRLGHPSKRQRLTDRVYHLLGFDSALKQPASLLDV